MNRWIVRRFLRFALKVAGIRANFSRWIGNRRFGRRHPWRYDRADRCTRQAFPPVYSGSDGAFSIDRVAPGRYMVRVEKAQFGPARVPLEVAEAAQPEPLRITLQVSGVSETVTITDERNFIPLTIASGATKTDTPILDQPRAIQIIAALLLEDLSFAKNSLRN